MASNFKTLADLILVNDMNLYDAVPKDVLDSSPFIASVMADTASNGSQHKYLKYTAMPATGFRAMNTGRSHDKSVDELVSLDCEILDASFTVDKNLADNYAKGGPSAYIQREAARHLQAAFFKAEIQAFYGTDATLGDPAGPTGMFESHNSLANPMVVNAGGTVGDLTSVWAVRSARDDFQFIMGEGGNMTISPSSQIRALEEGQTDRYYPAYFTPVEGQFCFQLGSIWAYSRLANLDDNANTLDDQKLAELLATHPIDHTPNFLVMNRRSLWQLQSSRTAYHPTGQPPVIPNQAHNIPIIVTEAIQNTEAAVA